jgi:hypothetical protein
VDKLSPKKRKLGTGGGLVECDELALDMEELGLACARYNHTLIHHLERRKYFRGKRARKEGVTWVQTILDVGIRKNGTRFGKTLKAAVLQNRNADSLQRNLAEHVHPTAHLQTDNWRGYSGTRHYSGH